MNPYERNNSSFYNKIFLDPRNDRASRIKTRKTRFKFCVWISTRSENAVCNRNNASDSKSTYDPGGDWRAQKKVGRKRGRKQVNGRRSCFIARCARLFYPAPDNDKMPVPEYSVSPMIHHSARSSARCSMQSPRAMVCTRPIAAGKLNRVEARGGLSGPWLVLLMLLGSHCCPY